MEFLKSPQGDELTFFGIEGKDWEWTADGGIKWTQEKMDIIAKKIYRADGVVYTAKADKSIREVEALGLDRVPICVAKTQYSLSDNPTMLGKPEGFKITVSDVRASSGAGFVVIYTGDIMTMPGLPKVPSAEKIDVDENGVISGLF